jgi:hypothetical protein
MKPYGLQIIEYPDVADIQFMAAKSSIGRMPSKSGEYRSYTRSVQVKKAMRRYWKRKARKENKALCACEGEY